MRHRKVMITAAALVPLAWGFTVVRPYLWGHGPSTEVPVEEVIRRYQESTTPVLPPDTEVVPPSAAVDTVANTEVSVPTSAPVLPLPGVYVYATTGGDSVDALSGDRHTYPDTTTITIIERGCGVAQRWDVLVERWEEWQRCVLDGGVAWVGKTNYDSFFGRSQTDVYECAGDARPVDAARGTTWAFECRQGDKVERYSGEVIGTDTISVGAERVDALHVRVSIDNGNVGDAQVTDSWYLVGSDLLLVQSGENHTTNPSPIGDVHYAERYEIRLTALEPVS